MRGGSKMQPATQHGHRDLPLKTQPGWYCVPDHLNHKI